MAAVEAILASGKTITLLEKRLDTLEKCLMDPNSSPQQRLYAQENIESTRTAVAREKRKELLLRQQLDVKDRAILNLKDYRPYFTARMSARTLKERIQVKLREHKFEYSIIERSVRRTTSGRIRLYNIICASNYQVEKKRNDHTSDAIKKREPTIQKLINLYNDECKTIEQLISRRKAPKDSIAPEPLPKKGIFQLDVDDAIWRELGLNDDETTARPRWLLDPKVRDGIRAMLKKDRCAEDSHRLLREREHLQIWFAFEWKVVCELIAITEPGNYLHCHYDASLHGGDRACSIPIRNASRGAAATLRSMEAVPGSYHPWQHRFATLGTQPCGRPGWSSGALQSIVGQGRQIW